MFSETESANQREQGRGQDKMKEHSSDASALRLRQGHIFRSRKSHREKIFPRSLADQSVL